MYGAYSTALRTLSGNGTLRRAGPRSKPLVPEVEHRGGYHAVCSGYAALKSL